MDTKGLAKLLRVRLGQEAWEGGGFHWEACAFAQRLSDEDLIDAYNTCALCNQKTMSPESLAKLIDQARTATAFLASLDEASQHDYGHDHYHGYNPMEADCWDYVGIHPYDPTQAE
jgi:hypothetical protein